MKLKGVLKKVLPVILALAMAAPSVSDYNTPVLAQGSGEGVAVQTEESGENTGEITEGEADRTGALEEGIYMLSLKPYTVDRSPMNFSSADWSGIGGSTPAWNEKAKLEVVSGGAITLTLQAYSAVNFDAFQVMKLEESEKIVYGAITPEDINEGYAKIYEKAAGNATLAGFHMGTFNLPEGIAADSQWFSAANDNLYYREDKVSVTKDPVNGYTYLSVKLDSIEDLDKKLLIKSAFISYSAKPVTTSFFVFDRGNMVKMPSLEEFMLDIRKKPIQLSDIYSGSSFLSKINPDDQNSSYSNMEKLFEEADIAVAEGKITVSGEMNPEAFYDPASNRYGLGRIRKYAGQIPPGEGISTEELLKYVNPYYNVQFETFYNDYYDKGRGYGFSLTFDYTIDNLIFGVPISVGTVNSLSAGGSAQMLADLPEEELGSKYSVYYARLRILSQPADPVVKISNDGQVRLTTDTTNVSADVVFQAEPSENGYWYQDYKSNASQIQAWSYKVTTVSGAAIIANKNMEISVKLPGDWTAGSTLTAVLFAGGSTRTYKYKDGSLKINDGWISMNTSGAVGEIYLYKVYEPEDLSVLEEGAYRVNIAAMHAGAAGQTSAANSALVKEATLVIRKDGQGNRVKELYVDYQLMYFASLEGYLSNVATADNYNQENLAFGEIMDYFTAGNSDELLLEPNYLNSYGVRTYLVRRSKLTLKDYTGSDAVKQNYYPLYFEVPAMDSDPTDGVNLQVVRLLVTNARKLDSGNAGIPAVEKTVLKKELLEGSIITGDVYTETSFSNLRSVLWSAEEVYGSNPGEADILAQVKAIRGAVAALVVDEAKKANKTVLGQLLDQAAGYEEGKYTVTSYENLKNAVTLAKAVYEKEAASQAEVNEKAETLSAAMAALVLIDFGALSPAELPAGTYTIPVRLWHAVNDSPSMGDAGIVSTGVLEVTEGEGGKKAALQLELVPLVVSGLKGYLMDLDILTQYTIEESGYPAAGYGKLPAGVTESYDITDEYNGNDSGDDRSRGRKYPKTVKMDVTLPETTGTDYIWVHVYVPLMGSVGAGDHEARLRLDYTGLAIQGEPSLSLDYTALNLTEGDTKILKATLKDADGTVSWSSSNTAVAKVDSNGKITALSAGTATVTAAVGNLLASCLVTVTAAGTGGDNGGNTGGNTGGTLKNGTYSIPVSLWHAAKDQVSLGNASLVQSARLVIKDGSGTLYITFQPMTYLGLTGYLSELIPSTVISTYDTVDQYNGESSTDARVKGTKYPKSLAVQVVPGAEYTTVRVYVPVMGALGVGEQDARLKLNYASAVLISDSTSTDLTAGDLGEGTSTVGLEQIGGKTYVYENGLKVTNKLVTYFGKAYYAGEDGAVVTSGFIKWQDRTYYAGEDGAVVTNSLVTAGDKLYFAGYGGEIAAGTMLTHEGKRYYATDSGEIAVSSMISYESGRYIAGEDGVIKTSVVLTYGGKKYYATVTGRLAASALVTYKGSKYYAKADSSLAVSSIITYNGDKYFADKTGKIAATALFTYKNARYYAGKDGVIVTSRLITTSQGLKYYAAKSGKIAVSTVVTYKGKKYYAAKSGKISTLALVTYKNAKYYAGKDGALVTSKWVTIKGKSYYFDKNGKLVKTK